ncbi:MULTISPECIES: hypothetical protein [Pasteurellaceae]|uniref:hypothetical protein n=1 Tax=Pasteurellaceae TaxID=712 RepID=UPI00356ABC45
MKNILLVTLLLLSACSMRGYQTEKLSPSCQIYFAHIERNLAQSTLPAEKLAEITRGFDNTKAGLKTLSAAGQEKICRSRLAQLASRKK